MAGYVIKRLLWAGALMLIISFCTFILFLIVPSVEVERARGTGTTSLTNQYQLEHKSLPFQYVHFLWAIVRHGDLGHSYVDRRPVSDILVRALPVTASLVIGGSMLWLLMAFPIGILSALRPRSLLDRISMAFVLIGVSAHPIWIGLMFSYFLGLKLGITPIGGYCKFFHPLGTCGGAVDWAYHLVLPWLTFAFLFAALYARMIRAVLIETLSEDYVRTAQAKGAGRWRVLRRHVLRNALMPVVTMLGMDVGLAFGGVVFVETVYSLPGIGNRLVRALPAKDLPVLMGVVLVVSLAVVVANLIVDLAYRWLDPKIRLAPSGEGRPVRFPRLSVSAESQKVGVSGSPT